MSKIRRFTQIFISALLSALSVFYIVYLAFTTSIPVYGSETANAVDKDGLFKYSFYPYEQSVANYLADGDAVPMDSILLEERTINEVYIESMDEAVRVASVGSSRIHQLSSSVIGEESFHNFGVSGGDLLDVINSSVLLVENGMLEEYLVIGLDPWILNSNVDAYSTKSNTELYGRILNEYMGYSNVTYSKPNLRNIKESLSFFYRDTLLDRPVKNIGKNVDIYDYPADLKTNEGNVIYGAVYRDVDKDDIKMRALMESPGFIRMENYYQPDSELIEIFDKFISYMQDKGIKVIFMLVPYNPVMYDYVSEYKQLYPAFFMIEDWYVEYAKSKNIPVYGSYNPYIAGCEITDFYDGYHIKAESINKFLPQIDLIKLHEKEGHASSAYHLEELPISKEMALYITGEKYAVRGNQLQRLIGDVTAMDKDCYNICTYSSDSARASKVAEYAVSKENGTIYRLGRNGSWIYDFEYNANSDRIVP